MNRKFGVVLEELKKLPKMTSTTINRLGRVASEFVSDDDFFRATKGELMRTWSKIAPESPRGLGQTFFDAFSKAKALWTSDEVGTEAARPADPLGRQVTQELLLWMASFMESNSVEQMPIGHLLDIWDQVQEAKK